MSRLPLISVALCTYNGEDYLQEQLDSLLAQSYDKLEIIAVDDCSSDRTVSILRHFAQVRPGITVIENPYNLGYNKNFEKALALCSGDYIAICDQDDIWHKDKLRLQYEAIRNHNLIYHDSAFIDQQGKSLNLKISDKFSFYRGSSPLPFIYLNCVSGHSILVKKNLLHAALPFPKGFHYDQWLVLLAAAKGSVDYIDQCLVQYRQHERNSTNILAQKPKKRSSTSSEKIQEIHKESEWLKLCTEITGHSSENRISELYKLSLQRHHSFVSFAYGYTIWNNRHALLSLLKKNEVSKLFYVLRKIWGVPLKKMFS